MEEEANNVWSAGSKMGGGSMNNSTKNFASTRLGDNSTMIEREKRQLEKIKMKQTKELERMIEQELRMGEIRMQNEQKNRICGKSCGP